MTPHPRSPSPLGIKFSTGTSDRRTEPVKSLIKPSISSFFNFDSGVSTSGSDSSSGICITLCTIISVSMFFKCVAIKSKVSSSSNKDSSASKFSPVGSFRSIDLTWCTHHCVLGGRLSSPDEFLSTSDLSCILGPFFNCGPFSSESDFFLFWARFRQPLPPV